jgi:hypothetical protein
MTPPAGPHHHLTVRGHHRVQLFVEPTADLGYRHDQQSLDPHHDGWLRPHDQDRGGRQLGYRTVGHRRTVCRLRLLTSRQAEPAIAADSSGQGVAVVVNENGSRNSDSSPAPRGSVVTLYATGEGLTSPSGVDGKLAGSPLPAPVLPVQLFIGDVPAEIQYVGGVLGQVAGLMQINARLAAGTGDGRQPLLLRIGQAASPTGVFLIVG